jgi:hypothetical protein
VRQKRRHVEWSIEGFFMPEPENRDSGATRLLYNLAETWAFCGLVAY